MKVLLDENLSRRLRRLLVNHEATTVAYQGWRGVVNGSLLNLAEQHGFEVFLTADQSVPPQQNMRNRTLGVIVLSVNKFSVHRARIASIDLAIANCAPGTVTVVNLE